MVLRRSASIAALQSDAELTMNLASRPSFQRASRLMTPLALAAALALSAGPALSDDVLFYPTHTPEVGSHYVWAAPWHWYFQSVPGPNDNAVLGPFDVYVYLPAPAFSIHGSGNMLLVEGGSISLAGSSSIGSLSLSGGTVGGAAALAVQWPSTWASGTMNGAGSTTFSGALTLDGSGSRTLDRRSLNLLGTTTLSGNASLSFMNGAVLTNKGSFVDQNASSASLTGSGLFSNQGSYTKTGAGTSTIGTSFGNTGTLTVEAGTLDLTGGLSNFSGGTLSGGSYVVKGAGVLKFAGASIVSNAAAITLAGSAAKILRSSDGANALADLASITATGSLTLQGGATFAAAAGFTNAGQLIVGAGSTFSPKLPTTFGVTNFTNLAGGTVQLSGGEIDRPMTNAGSVIGHGRLSGAVLNIGGTVRASGGTLAIASSLGGKVAIDAGATLSLETSNTVSTFSNAGTLALGTRNLSVSADYSNANFGAGNAFNRRAGVTGTGKILATGNVQQTLSGEFITLGNTANPVLTLPNQRVGAALTTSFTINNPGSSGPSLRGAIQTGGITSAALSGSGVTAQNWGAVAPGGASGSFALTYQLKGGQSLVGQNQALSIVNNFDNVAGQTLSITGGKVYTPAVAWLGGNVLDFGIVHVGAKINQGIAVINNANATGLNDVLLATASGGGGAYTVSGSLAGLGAGSLDYTSLRVGLDTSKVGLFNSTATLAFASHNEDMSDLALDSKQIALRGQVNNYAVLGLSKADGAGTFTSGGKYFTQYTLNFGTVKEGAASISTELMASNLAPGLADLLSLEFEPSSIDPNFSLSGFSSIAGLAAGESQHGLQISFSGLQAGHFYGAVTLYARGRNASGYNGWMPTASLRLEGEVAAVPEPASWAQLALGLAGLLGFMARRRMGGHGGRRARG